MRKLSLTITLVFLALLAIQPTAAQPDLSGQIQR